jgi:hypothetical protein
VSTEVVTTPRADQQINQLRSTQTKQLTTFVKDLESRGCAALGYRLTGDEPLEHLCVKHLGGQLRVIVAFERADRAWLLLVGPHDDSDPDIDVYTELYQLVGFRPPDSTKRTKPPCCGGDGEPPALGKAAEELADGAV